MKLIIPQKLLSLQEKTAIYDEQGSEKYYAEGLFAVAKNYRIYDPAGHELASVHQKKVSSTGTCIIERNGEEVARVIPKITLVKPKYAVTPWDWTIEGNFKQSDFVIKEKGKVLVSVKPRLFTKGNAFEIDIEDGADEINALACVLIIEGLFETQILNAAVMTSFLAGK